MPERDAASTASPPPTSPASDSSDLAAALVPALVAACGGRLSDVQWFRSSWQSGGASTAYAKYAVEEGPPQDVVVKLPVGPSEYRWTTQLGGGDGGPIPASSAYACGYGPTPRVFASGLELGGYDLAWLVVERFRGGPVSAHLDAAGVQDLLTTAAEWYARAEQLRDISQAPAPETTDWDGLMARAREAIRNNTIAEAQRWSNAVKAAHKMLPALVARWDSRPINTWCHGDLHPGNAMKRDGSGRCVLIDLALVHPGHWVEDAVYLERLYWGRSELLGGVKVVSFLAKARRDRGLLSAEDYTMLANVRRVLMAATAPIYLAREGHPRYIHAALETLERLLPLVSR